MEKHLIVFGDSAESQIKKHAGRIKSYREAQWLYDGILYQDDIKSLDINEIVFRDPKFSPDALIDNGKWIDPDLFRKNKDIWQAAIKQCFEGAKVGEIHCFTYFPAA